MIKIKPENKGKLHSKLGISQSAPIPASKLAADPHDSPALTKEKNFARNARRWNR